LLFALTGRGVGRGVGLGVRFGVGVGVGSGDGVGLGVTVGVGRVVGSGVDAMGGTSARAVGAGLLEILAGATAVGLPVAAIRATTSPPMPRRAGAGRRTPGPILPMPSATAVTRTKTKAIAHPMTTNKAMATTGLSDANRERVRAMSARVSGMFPPRFLRRPPTSRRRRRPGRPGDAPRCRRRRA
jgi:hypothetical protein